MNSGSIVITLAVIGTGVGLYVLLHRPAPAVLAAAAGPPEATMGRALSTVRRSPLPAVAERALYIEVAPMPGMPAAPPPRDYGASTCPAGQFPRGGGCSGDNKDPWVLA